MVAGRVKLYATCVSRAPPTLPLKQEYPSLGVEAVLRSSSDSSDDAGPPEDAQHGNYIKTAVTYDEYLARRREKQMFQSYYGAVENDNGKEFFSTGTLTSTPSWRDENRNSGYSKSFGLSMPSERTSFSRQSSYSEKRSDVESSHLLNTLKSLTFSSYGHEADMRENNYNDDEYFDDCATVALNMICAHGCVEVLFATRENPVEFPCSTNCNRHRILGFQASADASVEDGTITMEGWDLESISLPHDVSGISTESRRRIVGAKMNPFYELCINPATTTSTVEGALERYPGFARLPTRDGRMALHAVCLRQMPDQNVLRVLNANTAENKAKSDENHQKSYFEQTTEEALLSLSEMLTVVTNSHVDAARVPDFAGDLPCQLLARQLWPIRKLCFDRMGKHDAAKPTGENKHGTSKTALLQMKTCIEIVLTPLGSIRPLCRAMGSKGTLLPLHIGALYGASYNILRSLLEGFSEGAAVKCEGAFPNCSGSFYPLDLFESNRSSGLFASQDGAQKNEVYTFDDCSDLIFCFYPNLLPYRKDIHRVLRIEKKICKEAMTRGALSAPLKSVWVWMCTFVNAIDSSDNYAENVRRVLGGVHLGCVGKLLHIKRNDEEKMLWQIAAPACAEVMKPFLEEYAKQEKLGLLKRPHTRNKANESAMDGDGELYHVTCTPMGAICREIFNVSEDGLPTCFIILPYKVNLKKDGTIMLESEKDMDLAAHFAFSLLSINKAEFFLHDLEKRKECEGGWNNSSIQEGTTIEEYLAQQTNDLLKSYKLGVGYLYLMDESQCAPALSQKEAVYPIEIDMRCEQSQKLLPLMQMGTSLLRGERGLIELARTIVLGSARLKSHGWTQSAKSVLQRLAKVDHDLSRSLQEQLSTIITASEAGKNAPLSPPVSFRWSEEVEYLKIVLARSDVNEVYAGLKQLQTTDGNYVWTSSSMIDDNDEKDIGDVENASSKEKQADVVAASFKKWDGNTDKDMSSPATAAGKGNVEAEVLSQDSLSESPYSDYSPESSHGSGQKDTSNGSTLTSSDRSYEWSEFTEEDTRAARSDAMSKASGSVDLDGEQSSSSETEASDSMVTVALDSDLEEWLGLDKGRDVFVPAKRKASIVPPSESLTASVEESDATQPSGKTTTQESEEKANVDELEENRVSSASNKEYERLNDMIRKERGTETTYEAKEKRGASGVSSRDVINFDKAIDFGVGVEPENVIDGTPTPVATDLAEPPIPGFEGPLELGEEQNESGASTVEAGNRFLAKEHLPQQDVHVERGGGVELQGKAAHQFVTNVIAKPEGMARRRRNISLLLRRGQLKKSASWSCGDKSSSFNQLEQSPSWNEIYSKTWRISGGASRDDASDSSGIFELEDLYGLRVLHDLDHLLASGKSVDEEESKDGEPSSTHARSQGNERLREALMKQSKMESKGRTHEDYKVESSLRSAFASSTGEVWKRGMALQAELDALEAEEEKLRQEKLSLIKEATFVDSSSCDASNEYASDSSTGTTSAEDALNSADEAQMRRQAELEGALLMVEMEEQKLRELMDEIKQEFVRNLQDMGLVDSSFGSPSTTASCCSRLSPSASSEEVSERQSQKDEIVRELQEAIAVIEEEEMLLMKEMDELRELFSQNFGDAQSGRLTDLSARAISSNCPWPDGKETLWAEEGEVGTLKAALYFCAEEVEHLEQESFFEKGQREALTEQLLQFERELGEKEQELTRLRVLLRAMETDDQDADLP